MHPVIFAASVLPPLPGLWSLTPIGALIGLIVLIGFMLTTGKLYTKGTHAEIMQLHEERYKAEKAVSMKRGETIDSLLEQNTALIRSNVITADFLKEADSVRDGGSEDGKPRAV